MVKVRSRRVLKWGGFSLGCVGLVALLWYVGTAVCQYGERRQREETGRRFCEIAYGFKIYSDRLALGAAMRTHLAPGKGLLSQDVPWGTGPLPSAEMSWPMAKRDGSATQGGEEKSSYAFSWRYALFPLLIGVNRLLHYDQPWYVAVNRGVVNRYGTSMYAKISDDYPDSESLSDKPIRDTIALAITGPGTAFGDGKEPPMRLNEVPPAAILVVECRASGIPWPAPGDFDIRTMPHTVDAPDGKGISGVQAGGFHVIFGDRQVWFMATSVPFETLQKFFTVADARKYDREELLGPYALQREGSP